MTTGSYTRWLSRIGWSVGVLLSAILGGSAISNLLLSSRSEVVERLSEFDKAIVREAFHLRRAKGDSVWAGWASANIPMILYNEEYAFLIGLRNPVSGWRTVPLDVQRGTSWEGVDSDEQEYCRQRLPDETASPQAFTVRVGETWVASMTTLEWMRIKMGNEIRDRVPPLIRPVVPYRLIGRIFLGLAMSTEAYCCALNHESFHAYQGMVAPRTLARAETALRRLGGRYPWGDSLFSSAWSAELNTLADAVMAEDETDVTELSRKFLTLRQRRRLVARLDTSLVDLEQVREWEEGLAKYTELWLWQHAQADSLYHPIIAPGNNAGFEDYKGFEQYWNHEMITLRLQSHGGETRFYYAGMAQAFLLDRLLPGWRTRALRSDTSLEDLLREATKQPGSFQEKRRKS